MIEEHDLPVQPRLTVLFCLKEREHIEEVVKREETFSGQLEQRKHCSKSKTYKAGEMGKRHFSAALSSWDGVDTMLSNSA